jgi:hypothetical protein
MTPGRPKNTDTMNTAATTATTKTRPRKRKSKRVLLTHAEMLAFLPGLKASAQPKRPRTRLTPEDAPKTGTPAKGSLLDKFMNPPNPNNPPVYVDGLVYVSVEGQHPRKAILNAATFDRLTARDPQGPWLTRTRWFLDDESGMLHAYTLRNGYPLAESVMVAAAILDAQEGDSIEAPADPFDLRDCVLCLA